MPKVEVYFLDTSILCKTCEFFRVLRCGGDPAQFRRYYDSITQLVRDGHKVLLSPISILEIEFLYHRWFYWDRKVRERASFDEIFGRNATYELSDSERAKIRSVLTDFGEEAKQLGIEFSKADQNDVLRLASFLYGWASPSVEPYDLAVYSNSILDSASYVITVDSSLCRTIDYFRKNYKENIRNEITSSFGEDKYPYWRRRRDLPNARRP